MGAFDNVARVPATGKLVWRKSIVAMVLRQGPGKRARMHVRRNGREEVHELRVGDIFHADAGCEHVAHPHGPARILVVERAGSV